MVSPVPSEWLSIDEDERIELVAEYHNKARIITPNLNLHACMHVLIENQLAMNGIVEVRETLDRLQVEGLDRHEAIHAIARIVSGNIFEAMKFKKDFSDDEYRQQLKEMTARRWAAGE